MRYASEELVANALPPCRGLGACLVIKDVANTRSRDAEPLRQFRCGDAVLFMQISNFIDLCIRQFGAMVVLADATTELVNSHEA